MPFICIETADQPIASGRVVEKKTGEILGKEASPYKMDMIEQTRAESDSIGIDVESGVLSGARHSGNE